MWVCVVVWKCFLCNFCKCLYREYRLKQQNSLRSLTLLWLQQEPFLLISDFSESEPGCTQRGGDRDPGAARLIQLIKGRVVGGDEADFWAPFSSLIFCCVSLFLSDPSAFTKEEIMLLLCSQMCLTSLAPRALAAREHRVGEWQLWRSAGGGHVRMICRVGDSKRLLQPTGSHGASGVCCPLGATQVCRARGCGLRVLAQHMQHQRCACCWLASATRASLRLTVS